MTPNKVHIYYLSQKNKNHIYIGSTVNPNQRFGAHQRGGDSKLIKNKLFSKTGMKMKIIDTVSRNERFIWEKFYIDFLQARGFNLINSAKILNVNRKERTEFRYLNQRKNKKTKIANLLSK